MRFTMRPRAHDARVVARRMPLRSRRPGTRLCRVGRRSHARRRTASLASIAFVLARGVHADAAEVHAPPDRDDDGVTDADEKRLGLDPDTVNIPEPLLFDMVRGLGARRGEVELNVLAQGGAGADPHLTGGPEVEYVFAPGHAVEVELPMSSRGVDAWKGSLQGTLPAPGNGRFVHGWLVTGEYLLGDPDVRCRSAMGISCPLGEGRLGGLGARATALYVVGLRFDRHWSAVAMIGGRGEKERRGRAAFAVLNPSIFYDASSSITFGMEMNSLLEDDGTTDLVLLPQVHWQPSRAWKLQVGSGAHVDEAGATWLTTARVCLTY